MSTASWTCVQYVYHCHVRQPEGDASTDWYCHQWTFVTVQATPTRLPASIVPHSQTFYHGMSTPAGPPNGFKSGLLGGHMFGYQMLPAKM